MNPLLAQRRAMAERLMQQSQNTPGSSFQAIANGLAGIMGSSQLEKIAQQEQASQDRQRKILSTLLTAGSQEEAQAILAQDPDLSAQFAPALFEQRMKAWNKQDAPIGASDLVQINTPNGPQFVRASEAVGQSPYIKPENTQKDRPYYVREDGSIDPNLFNAEKQLRTAAAQLRIDNPMAAQPQKAPPGYRYSADGETLEPIPGGPADQKVQQAFEQRQGAADAAEQTVNTVDQLLANPGLEKAVGWQSMLPTLPGTDAANFEAQLETLKAQTFLPQVQKLKGAGALSDAEGKKLTAAIGALDTRMGDAAFRTSLQAVREELAKAETKLRSPPGRVSAAPTGRKRFNPQTGRIEAY